MKILDGAVVFSSTSQFEQMDLSLQEKNIEAGRGRVKKMRVERDRFFNNTPLARVIVDRVSIDQKTTMAFQSNYTSSLSSKSTVVSRDSETVQAYSQEYVMEKLVGGIIEKEAVIKSMEMKTDVFMPSERVLTQGDAIAAPDTPVSSEAARAALTASAGTYGQTRIAVNQTDIHFEDQNVDFVSRGKVTTEDGRTIDFSLDLSLDRTFLSRTQEETLINKWQESVVLTDPLVINLDGSTPQLSDARFEFDLDSDGTAETINFVKGGNGFLAFDRNQDNVINNGSELFGPGTGNGFEELAAYDDDQNHWIDENDAIFSQLSVWTKDDKGNDQLISLKDAGLGAIALGYASTEFNMTQDDNTLQGKMQRTGVFLFETGQVGSVHQVDLAAHEPEPEQAPALDLTQATPDSGSMPGTLQTAPVNPVAQPAAVEEVTSPLQDLLNRIDKLKEEMERLLETSRSGRKTKRYGQSPHKRYGDIQMVPPDLTAGPGMRLARISKWYI